MNTELEKIKHYCAYQERCHSEVRHKLLELKVYGNDLESIMAILIEENFLNEERFACAFARGKFYFKKWGKNKIKHELKAKHISTYLIQIAMKEIDDSDYENTLHALAEKKLETLQGEKNIFVKMSKIKNYLLQKGYENDLVYAVMKKIM